MSVNKIKLNTTTPFFIAPNTFAQCDSKILSAEAKGTGVFLQSLPSGWQIHPTWVQLKMGFGKRVWMRVAKELIKYGCLILEKGGMVHGSYYIFSLYNCSNQLSSAGPVECRELHNATVAFCDSRKNAPLIKKQNKKKETSFKNKQQQEHPAGSKPNSEPNIIDKGKGVVVNGITKLEGERIVMDELLQIGLSQRMVDRILVKFTITRVAEVIKMYREVKPSSPGWIVTALKEEWKPTENKVIPEAPASSKINLELERAKKREADHAAYLANGGIENSKKMLALAKSLTARIRVN